ncbi:hypothetical protein [Thalassotalea euphylliae]|uniref:Uncharacterized protein n=1 Tax=Thalassotalea euphylliae TaxID=1655234 RepID=A0A3E0TYX4_9GAMM|nr:hypothetical protein [Thalassotalea euphylliae]REL29856.1 hypothetical protein DXX94_03575 [Thalassotalea euphylliae]
MTMRILCLLMAVTFSSLSFAHPGHDHSDPMAMLIHLLWLAPIGLAFAIAFRLKKKHAGNSKEQK